MGLSWQQGPLAPGAVGRFLVPGPLPDRMLFAEPLRRRMRVRFGGAWIADSEDVVLLHEPGRYPVAYFPLAAVADGALEPAGHTTRHADLGPTAWYTVQAGEHSKPRAAWQHTELPDYASELKGRVACAWRAMEAFYEEDERIVGHAADPYHRVDIRQTSRHLTVRYQDLVIADTRRPLALYESGFAPRWYVARADVDQAASRRQLGKLLPDRGEAGARADPDQHALLARRAPRHLLGVMGFDGDHPVEDVDMQIGRNEARGQALDRVRSRLAARNDRG